MKGMPSLVKQEAYLLNGLDFAKDKRPVERFQPQTISSVGFRGALFQVKHALADHEVEVGSQFGIDQAKEGSTLLQSRVEVSNGARSGLGARIGCGIPGADSFDAKELASLCPDLTGCRDNYLFDGPMEVMAIYRCIIEAEQLLSAILAIRLVAGV